MIIRNFKAMVDVLSNEDESLYVEYTLFSMGKSCRLDQVVCQEVQLYDVHDHPLPGMRANVYLNEVNGGNPFTFSDTFDIPANMSFSAERPFIEVNFFIADKDDPTKTPKYKGGVIIRTSIPD